MGIPDNDHDQIICWFMVDINAVNAAMARLAHDQGQRNSVTGLPNDMAKPASNGQMAS
jgi:hypothetical protein